MSPSLDLTSLERYRQSLSHAWRHTGDSVGWPIKLNAAIHLFVPTFGEEFLDDLAELEARGVTLPEIARPFYNPARLYRVIDSLVYSMRRRRYAIHDQRVVVMKLLAMARSLKFGSAFNEDGRNIVLPPGQAREIAATKVQPIHSVAESQAVHRFCAGMWTYTEAICFRAHDVTQEMHGPYDTPDGRDQLIVKEYLNLRPTDLWPDMPLLPCAAAKVYLRYTRDLKITIDAFNHVYHDGGTLVPNLSGWGAEIDGEAIELRDLSAYLPLITRAVTTISHDIDTYDWHRRVLKYADIFWFRKAPLSGQRGRPWQTPAHVREAILAGAEHESRRTSLSKEGSERLALLTI